MVTILRTHSVQISPFKTQLVREGEEVSLPAHLEEALIKGGDAKPVGEEDNKDSKDETLDNIKEKVETEPQSKAEVKPPVKMPQFPQPPRPGQPGRK